MRRRALLASATSAVLAGCSGQADAPGATTRPKTGTTTGTTTDPTSTVETADGGSEPGPAPRVTAVDQSSLRDVGLAIELTVDKRANRYSPAMVRATLRNESETRVSVVCDGVVPLGNAHDSDDESLFLAPQRLDMAGRVGNVGDCRFAPPEREGRCWQSQGTISTMDRLAGHTLYPGEAISNVHDVLVAGRHGCVSEGEYEFTDSRLQYERPDDDRRTRVEWGFTLYYPGPSG
ncbi:hypothetical protein [Haloarchaeobius baliensis]|uniref:hypothetical protein n=1 Tax=Haloarchaeobius baliensis TaxID=1670458 RepID=UPI003F88055D